MIKKKKFDREVIIIYICLNKLFIFSTNHVYCKNKKCLSKECLVDNYHIKNWQNVRSETIANKE